jgi:hypothetical protein
MDVRDPDETLEVRDAVEDDAERLAELTGAPSDVMRNLVHDRTVRVACEEQDAEADLLGFVSFDAEGRTVHITQIAGTETAMRRLFEEPRRFASNEAMTVELLVPGDDHGLRETAEHVGFEEDGTGPRFDGTRTVRYRLEPE